MGEDKGEDDGRGDAATGEEGITSGGGEEEEEEGEDEPEEVSGLCFLGSVHFSSSVADMRKLPSERLPFFSSRALKLSLLVLERRRPRWMELVWRGRDMDWDGDMREDVGDAAVGVTGGDAEEGDCCCLWKLLWRPRSSSQSPRPRTFLFDLLVG